MWDWLQDKWTQIWVWFMGVCGIIRPQALSLFNVAMLHSKGVHGDNCIHPDCSKCLYYAREMLRAYDVTPEYYRHNASDKLQSVARAIADAEKEGKL